MNTLFSKIIISNLTVHIPSDSRFCSSKKQKYNWKLRSTHKHYLTDDFLCTDCNDFYNSLFFYLSTSMAYEARRAFFLEPWLPPSTKTFLGSILFNNIVNWLSRKFQVICFFWDIWIGLFQGMTDWFFCRHSTRMERILCTFRSL